MVVGSVGAFDRFVVVDWSASSTPKTGADSIWVAVLDRHAEVRTHNVATRAGALDLLSELTRTPGRCLVGVDFSLGYPRGTAAALGLGGIEWSATWELIADAVVDDDRNANNRFEVAAAMNTQMSAGPGPFWGCPRSRRTAHLTTTKVPSDPLPEWRIVEARLRERGMRPFSSWQLLGAGAVGSQSLLGIAAVATLVRRVAEQGRSVDVWPFTSGLGVPAGDVVVAEVWPTLVGVTGVSGPEWDGRVRDERQVVATARWLAAGDASTDLDSWFSPAVAASSRAIVRREEGWVLGA